MIEIREGGLDDARVLALLATHVAAAESVMPPGTGFAYDAVRLAAADIYFCAAWDGAALLGFGALKQLGGAEGEVKSMRVADAARGRGVGDAILERLIAVARGRGITMLRLETGLSEGYGPARAFYARAGFRSGPCFGEHRPTSPSLFMMREI